MSYLSERISYLKGLSEGMSFEEDTKESRFMTALVSVMEEMVESIDDLEDQNVDLMERVHELEEQLQDFYVGCDCEHHQEDQEDDDEDEVYDQFVAIECPECGEIVYFDQAMLQSDNDLICPECNASIVETVEDEDDEED